MSYFELELGRQANISLGHLCIVSSYTAAETTLHFVQLVRQLWALVGKMPRQSI